MTYETVTHVSQIFSLVLFMAVFLGFTVYACWPGNSKAFEHAARLPLATDDEVQIEGESDAG